MDLLHTATMYEERETVRPPEVYHHLLGWLGFTFNLWTLGLNMGPYSTASVSCTGKISSRRCYAVGEAQRGQLEEFGVCLYSYQSGQANVNTCLES